MSTMDLLGACIFISLSLFLFPETWIPYKGQSSNARVSENDRNLYTIRAVPFTEIRSICRHTPTLGWQYVIVVLSSGLAFPPLYFYNGGVRDFLATIKKHVHLVRSAGLGAGLAWGMVQESTRRLAAVEITLCPNSHNFKFPHDSYFSNISAACNSRQ